jgi:hypothetical protein
MQAQHNETSEAKSMNKLLTTETLRRQNLAFVGSGGISRENRSVGFRPAFHDLASGRTALARFADGRPAPMHLLDGLPEEWVVQRDASGRVCAIRDSVIAGFVRNGRFYTREQAAAALH